MSVKTFDFLKIQNSKLLVCEIRPVKCSVNTDAGRLKTTKWMTYQHWKELRHLLKNIAENYESIRNSLKVTEDIKHGKPQTKISDSIKIAYMWALNKECCRNFLTPRTDTYYSDSEEDPISLNDKGGRYQSLQACGDMLVVSVSLLDETEIQNNQKRSMNLHDLQSHRENTECSASSLRLDRSLIMALQVPTLVPGDPSISEYFTTQTSTNSDLDEYRKTKSRKLTSKNKTSENIKTSPMQQQILLSENIQVTRKKNPKSFFDTESSENSELLPKSSSSTSSDSQAGAAASKTLKETSTVASQILPIPQMKNRKSKRDDLPLKNNINDYTNKKAECFFSVPLVEKDQQNKDYFLKNIKVENETVSSESSSYLTDRLGNSSQLKSIRWKCLSPKKEVKTPSYGENKEFQLQDHSVPFMKGDSDPDCLDEAKENPTFKNFRFSFSSTVTPKISSPVIEDCIETPEPYMKVSNSPTSAKMTIDLHQESCKSNKLEVYSLDSLSADRRKKPYSKKMRKKSNVTSQDSHGSNEIRTDNRDGKKVRRKITKYSKFEFQNKDETPIAIKTEREFSYLIPHTTEEITDSHLTDSDSPGSQLHNFQIEDSVHIAENLIESSELPVSVMRASESVSRIPKSLDEPGDIRTRSKSSDMFEIATASPDLFDNSDETNKDLNTMETERCKVYISKSNDKRNTTLQYIPRVNDNFASTSSSVSEIDNVDDDLNNIYMGTQEKVSSATSILSNVERSPILESRKLKKKTNHLQSVSKRMKININNCNKTNKEAKKEDSGTLSIFLKKDCKEINKNQVSKNDKKEVLNIEDDIFEFSKSSINCIRERRTLDEIMRSNDGEEMDEITDEAIPEINSLDLQNIFQCNSTDVGDDNDNDNDDYDNDDLPDDNDDYDNINNDSDNEDLPDLGSAQDFDVFSNDSKSVLIKDKENTNTNLESRTSNVSSQSKRYTTSEYHKEDLNTFSDSFQNKTLREGETAIKNSKIHHLFREKNVDRDVNIDKIKIIKSTKYTPPKCGKASDIHYSPTPKELLQDKESKHLHKEGEYLSNDKDANSSNLECTLEEDSIFSSYAESAESPDTRRSQRIKINKEHGKRRSCECCENAYHLSPSKNKKSSIYKTKNDTNSSSEQNIEEPNINSSSDIGEKGKNRRKHLKRINLDHSSETTCEENLKKNNNLCLISADEHLKMISEPKNRTKNIELGSSGTKNNVLEKFNDTQALFDNDLPDGLECGSSKAELMEKTKKAMAEFDKMKKKLKSGKKNQDPDITMFMDSCQVTKEAKQIKLVVRKKTNANAKIKMANVSNNQPKLNTWLTKGNKKSNLSLEADETKASGSSDFENVLSENDLIYKQSLSKGRKKGEKRKISTNNQRLNKKQRSTELSSKPTFELHESDECKDAQENENLENHEQAKNYPLRKNIFELDENSSCYSSIPPVDEDNKASTSGTSEHLDSSVQITYEEKCQTQAEKAAIIACGLVEMSNDQLGTLVTKHLPYLTRIAKEQEENERHTIYMSGGAAARSNTPEAIFAPFTDEQLEHVHSILRNLFLEKLKKAKVEGREYLWMVLVPAFLIKIVMDQENVSYDDAELLFKHMAFPKRKSNRDSLGLGEPWD